VVKEKILAVYIKDPVYAGRFMDHCNADSKRRFKVIAFSTREALDGFLEDNTPECILCDEGTMDPGLERRTGLYRVLSEDGAPGTIFRYSAADAIISSIAGEMQDKEPESAVVPGGRITGFFGLFDDGESTIRAYESAEQSRAKTLLVSFSPFFCEDAECAGVEACKGDGAGEFNLSKLLFALSSGKQQDLSGFLKERQGFALLSGVAYVQDLDDISAETAEAFCRLLEDSGYERIFIDMGALRGFTPVVLDRCDSIFAIKRGTLQEQGRLKNLCAGFLRAGFERAAKRLTEAFA
jgi:hypothetical protein